MKDLATCINRRQKRIRLHGHSKAIRMLRRSDLGEYSLNIEATETGYSSYIEFRGQIIWECDLDDYPGDEDVLNIIKIHRREFLIDNLL